MQLKGLVRFFTIALIVICVYQLSLTWFVSSHEKKMAEKADRQLKYLQNPEQKYPGNNELQALYKDTISKLKDLRVKQLLDSTKDEKVVLGLGTYAWAKNQELKLGLDLQGGMSITLEVSMEGLIKSLANYTKDPQFNQALEAAVKAKATSSANLVDLFAAEYQKINPSGKLAPFFSVKSATGNSQRQIAPGDDNSKVISYLNKKSTEAFDNTVKVLRTRIDAFGLASPNINPDAAKGIINIELAGVNDPQQVQYLQSSANLQFFEVYNFTDVQDQVLLADKQLAAYLSNGDTTKAVLKTREDSATAYVKEHPLFIWYQGYQAQQNGYTSIVSVKDTGTISRYFNTDAVKSALPSNLRIMYGKLDGKNGVSKEYVTAYAIKAQENGQAPLEGAHVTAARQDMDGAKPVISMEMDAVGSRIWADLTGKNLKKPIAITMDNVVYSAPFVGNEPITGGRSQISGSFTVGEAQNLASILESGKLDAPAHIVQQQIIGPTLGEQAIKGGTLSFVIAFAVIFLLMLVYYNTAGWVANIALILNLFFTIGVLSSFGANLTAAGIAGLVLTIGMAVDTNVIIFERIKEELTRGKNYQAAVDAGYKRSLAPVLDAHVTTFLTAAILYYFGLGPVRGFATTQMIGIVLSLFCGILVSRLVTDWYTNKQRHFEYFTNVSKKVFKHASYKFIEYRKVAYAISLVVLILGVASFFHGFDQGVEFAGGRSYTVAFKTAPNVEQVRDELKAVFGGEAPVIKTVETKTHLNITTAYHIKERSNSTDSLVQQSLYNGLKKFLPAGLSYAEFRSPQNHILLGTQKVEPSISDDLKRGATTATIVSIIAICAFILLRFRDWRYSVGTIIALLHDVLVTLAVFSFLKDVVPFPLEIDQHFIAAVLTVIGFSMNDTVIVFDRVREYSRQMVGASKATIINRAINDTLSRTVMTSLTVFLTILILFIFGGEVTKGFAFAMLIGVVTGTYSSIFVAAPILIDMARNKPLGKAKDETVKATVAETV
jgi:SecD/SecF fusion protein